MVEILSGSKGNWNDMQLEKEFVLDEEPMDMGAFKAKSGFNSIKQVFDIHWAEFLKDI